MDIKLFDIAVYNRPLEEFNKYWNGKVEKNRRSETDEEWERMKYIYKECIGRCTHPLNSIIGYIHVWQSGGIDLITTLSIDCRDRKRLDGVPDILYDPSTFTRTRTRKGMTSEEILNQFNRDLLEGCNERLKGRYIDLEAWNNMSRLVDWADLFSTMEDDKKDSIPSKPQIHIPERAQNIEEISARYKVKC